jgi:hypothetical protein
MVENERHAEGMIPPRVGMPRIVENERPDAATSWNAAAYGRPAEQRMVENERRAEGMMPPRVGMPRMMEN